jgi:NADP-dependent 3-hydroxy acid dehydrogenase YdfG
MVCDIDITDDASLLGAVRRCELELGEPTLLVHAAGLSGAELVSESDATGWEQLMSRHITAYLCWMRSGVAVWRHDV